MDLLRQQSAMIDVKHDKLILGGKLIYVSNSHGSKINSRVVSRATVTIPPGREMVIPAKVYNKRFRRKGNFQACAMVVPSTGVSRRYGAIVARVLVAANTSEVPVRVYNPCDSPVTINKFATLGQLQTPKSIRPCPRINDTATLPAEDRATLPDGRAAAEQQPQAVAPTEQPATCPSVDSSQAAQG